MCYQLPFFDVPAPDLLVRSGGAGDRRKKKVQLVDFSSAAVVMLFSFFKIYIWYEVW